MSRRAWLRAIGGLVLVPDLGGATGRRWPRARAVSVSGLRSVTLAVADVGRSVDFYRSLFGCPVVARAGDEVVLRLGDGPAFMRIRGGGGQGPRFASFGLALRDDAGVEAVLGQLERAGASRSWLVADPHGMLVELHAPDDCGRPDGPGGCGDAEEAGVEAPLALTGFSHFTNNAADPARSVDFYRTVFGLEVQAYQAASPLLGVGDGVEFLMFIGGTVGRSAEEARAAPGSVHHACFTVADFSVERVLTALEGHGVRPQAEAGAGALRHWISMRMPDRGGAPEGTPELYFSDPDGLSIQLQDAAYCGGGGALGEICPG